MPGIFGGSHHFLHLFLLLIEWKVMREASLGIVVFERNLVEFEPAVGRDDVSAEALADLRDRLNTAADALRSKLAELAPRVHDVEERLKQLGPAPAKDAPPEATEIASQRAELTAR